MPRKFNGRKPRDFTEFKNSAVLNASTYRLWLDRLTDLAISRFKWENLPDSVDELFLELTLFSMGYAVWMRDPVLGVDLALTASLEGEFDVYNNPIYRRVYAANGYNVPCNNMDSVIIYNNYIHTGFEDATELYAMRLSQIDRVIDVNIKAQRTPVLIEGTENQRLTLLNLYMEYDGNQPFIMGNKDAGLDTISAIKTDAPLVAPHLIDIKHDYFNEYLSILGIENSNQDKKERMVADEVGSNYGTVEMQRRTGLNARQQAADKINEMFGLNISVNFNSELPTLVNSAFGGGDLWRDKTGPSPDDVTIEEGE